MATIDEPNKFYLEFDKVSSEYAFFSYVDQKTAYIEVQPIWTYNEIRSSCK